MSTSYTVPSESHKSLKMLSNSISEGAIFQKYLGGMPPDPLMVACFACICALHTMNLCFAIKDSSHNQLVVKTLRLCPPLQKSGSAPDGECDNIYGLMISL